MREDDGAADVRLVDGAMVSQFNCIGLAVGGRRRRASDACLLFCWGSARTRARPNNRKSDKAAAIAIAAPKAIDLVLDPIFKIKTNRQRCTWESFGNGMKFIVLICSLKMAKEFI